MSVPGNELELGHPERFKPMGTDHALSRPEGTDLLVVTYSSTRSMPSAIVWQGKQGNPILHCYFTTPQQRDKRVEALIRARVEALAAKQARKVAQREYRHGYAVGDVLVSTWGYDQTNVDFYKVAGTTEKTVRLVKVGSKLVREIAAMVCEVEADPERVVGKPFTRTVRLGGSVGIKSYSSAHRWDGKPVTETSYA